MKKFFVLSLILLLSSCSNSLPSNTSFNSVSNIEESNSTLSIKQELSTKVILNNIVETDSTDYSKEPALTSFKNKFLNTSSELFNDITSVEKIFATNLVVSGTTIVNSVRLGSGSTQGQFVVNTKIPVHKIIVNAHDYINYVEYNNSWIHDKSALNINGETKELDHSDDDKIINSTLIFEFNETVTTFIFKNEKVNSEYKSRIQLNYIEFIYNI